MSKQKSYTLTAILLPILMVTAFEIGCHIAYKEPTAIPIHTCIDAVHLDCDGNCDCDGLGCQYDTRQNILHKYELKYEGSTVKLYQGHRFVGSHTDSINGLHSAAIDSIIIYDNQ